jgi:peptide/nickel transport system permease protein
MVPTIFGVIVFVFIALRVLPGNVIQALTAEGGFLSEEQIATLEKELGLDKPLVVQFGLWWAGVFKGDFGHSLFHKKPTLTLWVKSVPVTLQLAIMGLLLALLIGVPIGTLSAVYQDKPIDYIARFISILGVSAPDFWLGTMIIVYSAIWFGYMPPADFSPFFDNPSRNLQQMMFPAVILGYRLSAVIMRMTRSTMLEVLRQDYMRTAYSKGLTRNTAIYRHALKNALIPVVTIVGTQMSRLLGGVVILETLFSLPGMGRLTFDSIYLRDYTQVQTQVFFIAVVFVVMNLVVDLSYGFLDPRIRYN